MNESTVKKIFIYVFVVGALLFSIWQLSKHAYFMTNANPAVIEVTHYTHSRDRAEKNSSNANVVFLLADGPSQGKEGHSMKILSFFKLHKVGTIAPGRYEPKTGVMMTNKYGWALVILNLVFVFLSGLMTWGVIKYGKDI